jgi:molybdopterin-binding protein
LANRYIVKSSVDLGIEIQGRQETPEVSIEIAVGSVVTYIILTAIRQEDLRLSYG